MTDQPTPQTEALLQPFFERGPLSITGASMLADWLAARGLTIEAQARTEAHARFCPMVKQGCTPEAH